jgi:hypothetical protein
MTGQEIARRRLANQRISAPIAGEPAEIVRLLAAVQAQDYAGAKWSVGLRLQGATDEDIERSFAAGEILRTHLLRPTWHFVTAADIRWLLALTAPRVHVATAHMVRKLDLDERTFQRSNDAMARALQGGQQLTRHELRGVLERAGIVPGDGVRLSYLMMRAELDGIVCSGPRRGKQFTYALLEDRAPQARRLDRPEALAKLAGRYFSTRGPATVHDFAKWSGLTVADARDGLEAVRAQLDVEVVHGQELWFPPPAPPATGNSPEAWLLSIYDEYISGFGDRSAIMEAGVAAWLMALGNALAYVIVVEGQVVGNWRRTLRKDAVLIEKNLFSPLTGAEGQAVAGAARRYGEFLRLPVVLDEDQAQGSP